MSSTFNPTGSRALARRTETYALAFELAGEVLHRVPLARIHRELALHRAAGASRNRAALRRMTTASRAPNPDTESRFPEDVRPKPTMPDPTTDIGT